MVVGYVGNSAVNVDVRIDSVVGGAEMAAIRPIEQRAYLFFSRPVQGVLITAVWEVTRAS